jgi:tetratricopeptide (TPR) repeat protein
MSSEDPPQVIREREALRNVRAVIDQLEHDETHRFRGVGIQMLAVIAFIAVLVLGAWSYKALTAPKTASMSVEQYEAHCLGKILKVSENEPRHVNFEGRQGTAILLLQVPPHGTADITIAKSSGDGVLDGWFFRLARLSQPFGPPPLANPGGVFELWFSFTAARSGPPTITRVAPMPAYLREDMSSCGAIDLQAIKLAGQRRLSEAAELYDRAIVTCPPDASRLSSRGVLASALGDKAQAERFILQAISLAERRGDNCTAAMAHYDLEVVRGGVPQNVVPENCRKTK